MHIDDSLIGWTVRLNMLGDWFGGRKVKLPIPPSRPSCAKQLKLNVETVPWRACRGSDPVRYDIPGTGRYIIDWSRNNRSGRTRELISGLWSSDMQYQQNSLWRLLGAMDKVETWLSLPMKVLEDGTESWDTVTKSVNISACVPSPYALLIGNISVHFVENQFNVSCNNCILTNCVSWVPSGTQVMILKQPSFVMLPVNISGPWYAERSLQIFKEIEYALSRQKRFIGLLIAGIMALVTIIATAATAAVALSQTIQNAQYVNTLSKNVSLALGTQEAIDEKLEQKVNALYDTVQYMGDVIHGMKVKSHLECHPEYHWICVTSKEYNNSQYDWNRVRLHLQGIWHNANLSLDMFRLHDEIQSLREAEPLKFDAAQAASNFVTVLKNAFPSLPTITHSITLFLTLGICICLALCLFPLLVKCFVNGMLDMRTDIHHLKLKAKP
ncbi:endogenous retrovirus group K member 7 Env polyprotein-like [Rhinolophus sinicus]|uniref:endogenous retrovirus group K member 7 Env polyprotein-like n=1 Tax=Rhinolophus sinicus TaxID=89399 RepID=UPI003D7A2897